MVEHYQVRGKTAAAIVDSVETGVRAGHLPPGAPLPTVRALAGRLEVANATVATAYRMLRQRGIVETAGRRGTHVRQRPAIALATPRTLPSGLRDLTEGDPDPGLLPDLNAGLANVSAVPGGYRTAGAYPPLITAARRRLAADGVHGQVAITGGALDGIERALSVHAGPGDAVGIEDPCWANLRDLVAAMGLRAVPMPVDDQGPTPAGVEAALRAGVRAMVVTSRAHNPTGAVISAARAAQLRDIFRPREDLLVIEDDHWAELSHDDLHPVVNDRGRWLFLRSVSKPYGPDLRLAVACGDADTVARMSGRMRIGSGWVSTILQSVVLGLWQDPRTPGVLETAADSYRQRREALLTALRQRAIPAWGHTGLNVWVPVSDETEAVAACRDAGFAVAAGRPFRIATPPAIRVTVSGMTAQHAPALAAAIAEVALR